MSLILGPLRNPESYVPDSWPFLELMVKSVPDPRLYELFRLAAKAETALFMNEMNLGEVFYLIAKEQGESVAQNALQTIARLPIRVVPVSAGDVLKAARLKARTTLSYADCFCAGVAMERDAAVVTGDRDFLELERVGLLRVDWVGA